MLCAWLLHTKLSKRSMLSLKQQSLVICKSNDPQWSKNTFCEYPHSIHQLLGSVPFTCVACNYDTPQLKHETDAEAKCFDQTQRNDLPLVCWVCLLIHRMCVRVKYLRALFIFGFVTNAQLDPSVPRVTHSYAEFISACGFAVRDNRLSESSPNCSLVGAVTHFYLCCDFRASMRYTCLMCVWFFFRSSNETRIAATLCASSHKHYYRNRVLFLCVCFCAVNSVFVSWLRRCFRQCDSS